MPALVAVPPVCPQHASLVARQRSELRLRHNPAHPRTIPLPLPQANPGDVVLKAGDVLLLDTGAGFRCGLGGARAGWRLFRAPGRLRMRAGPASAVTPWAPPRLPRRRRWCCGSSAMCPVAQAAVRRHSLLRPGLRGGQLQPSPVGVASRLCGCLPQGGPRGDETRRSSLLAAGVGGAPRGHQPAPLPSPPLPQPPCPVALRPPLLPRSFLHTFIAVGVTIVAFALFVAEVLDIVIGAALAATIMLITGERGGGMGPAPHRLGLAGDAGTRLAESAAIHPPTAPRRPPAPCLQAA